MIDKSVEILSEITIFTKYAKYLHSKKRRETWKEIVERNKEMHKHKFPALSEQIDEAYDQFVLKKKVLPSMRSLQFAGKPIDISPNRIFNCAFLPINDWRAFPEVMFLLLGGSGVGISVQNHHIEQLPEIKIPIKSRRFLVADSIEGWADAIKHLVKGYFSGGYKPIFDYSDIRPKGSSLITSGGKAPGPEPLRRCVSNIKLIFERKKDGEKLTSLEVHDMICYIADAVLAGGIRRAALISLFSFNDEEMLTCKYGNWWELNPQRGRANNSAVILRNRIQEEEFFDLWKKIQASGAGEPGMFFSNDKDWGLNPCAEISLRDHQFCNLVEVNVSDVDNQEEFEARCKAASFIGTLQASYTDFHYLRPIWKKQTEKEALIGVSLTGIASGKVLGLNLKGGADVVKKTNTETAKTIGINEAARTTTIKPAGTTSLVVGSSSGIHAWHAPYYIRRMRIGKNESIYTYLSIYHPELIKDEFFSPKTTAVIEIPQKAPENAITRDETVFELLERVKRFNIEWVKSGHRKGSNMNNVSATISIREDEWDAAGQWMWTNRKFYNGLSVLPYAGGSYIQAPFEDITEEEFTRLSQNLSDIDLSIIVEEIDSTDLKGEVACGGGNCEIQ